MCIYIYIYKLCIAEPESLSVARLEELHFTILSGPVERHLEGWPPKNDNPFVVLNCPIGNMGPGAKLFLSLSELSLSCRL